jgi:hypothetical protein
MDNYAQGLKEGLGDERRAQEWDDFTNFFIMLWSFTN